MEQYISICLTYFSHKKRIVNYAQEVILYTVSSSEPKYQKYGGIYQNHPCLQGFVEVYHIHRRQGHDHRNDRMWVNAIKVSFNK